MSNQQAQQRVRRIASPSLKTGPLKATLPFNAFVLKQGSSPTTVTARSTPGRKGQSPPTSPTPACWTQVPDSLRKTPRSPDHRASPDRASSPFIIKDKCRRHSPVPLIKRTSSLDTITTPYLKGEWPRETITPIPSASTYHTLAVPCVDMVTYTVEQATQTPEEWWEEVCDRRKKSHIRSTSLGNGDFKKEQMKVRLVKNKDTTRAATCVIPRTSPVHGSVAMASVSTTTHSKAMTIPQSLLPKPTIHIRGSVEGLSQEIETLVLKHTGENNSDELSHRSEEGTPDGHRAPIAELLCTTRTIDTQTPAIEELVSLGIHDELDEELDNRDSRSSSSSLNHTRSSSSSPACHPIIPGTMDTSRPSSLHDNVKDKECDSPKLKSIFIREPPDGCERIKIIQEEASSQRETSLVKPPPMKELLFCPIKNPCERYSIPSQDSAFFPPLLKPYVLQPSEMALRSSPTAPRPIEGQ